MLWTILAQWVHHFSHSSRVYFRSLLTHALALAAREKYQKLRMCLFAGIRTPDPTPAGTSASSVKPPRHTRGTCAMVYKSKVGTGGETEETLETTDGSGAGGRKCWRKTYKKTRMISLLLYCLLCLLWYCYTRATVFKGIRTRAYQGCEPMDVYISF